MYTNKLCLWYLNIIIIKQLYSSITKENADLDEKNMDKYAKAQKYYHKYIRKRYNELVFIQIG